MVSSHPRRTRTFQYGALVLYMLFLAFPLLWLLSVSFKGPRELVELHPNLIPRQWTFENFSEAFLLYAVRAGEIALPLDDGP